MKLTKQNEKRIASFLIQKVAVIILLFMFLTSCSNDDDSGPSSTISAQTQTFALNGTNNCDTSSGTGSTFVFTIPYTSSAGLTIEKLLIKTKVSDGGESPERVNTQITDNGTTITWVVCFRFGSQDWVEYEVRLEASDGTRSNSVTTRVNKPNGAN